MYLDSTRSPRESAAAAGSTELAEGLTLLRASTLKIIRLQLAIERHDRQVALEAVDELVALDRKLQDYLEQAPATGDRLMFRRELDSDRAALNEEKLTLAAGILRRPANSIEQRDPAQDADSAEGNDDWLGPGDLQFEPEEPRRRSRWWLATVPVLVSAALASGAYFVGFPEASAWLADAAGALR